MKCTCGHGPALHAYLPPLGTRGACLAITCACAVYVEEGD